VIIQYMIEKIKQYRDIIDIKPIILNCFNQKIYSDQCINMVHNTAISVSTWYIINDLEMTKQNMN